MAGKLQTHDKDSQNTTTKLLASKIYLKFWHYFYFFKLHFFFNSKKHSFLCIKDLTEEKHEFPYCNDGFGSGIVCHSYHG